MGILASYGSLARFMDNQRLTPFGSHVVVGASGDMSDWQNIQHTLTKLMEKEDIQGDGHSLTPEQVYAYLSHTMYERRSKLDPYWNALVLGGYDARADAGRESQLTEEEARAILEQCMRVLFYRDARSLNRFQIAKITKNGVHITEPYSVSTSWSFGEGLRGYGPQTQ